MEKFNELRNKWIDAIKPLIGLPTKALYFLLEPDDDKFFDTVDSGDDCLVGMSFLDFRMLAIEYLLEYKKQNNLKIKTEPHKPNTCTWPFGSLDNNQLQKLTRPITPHIVTPNSDVTWPFKTIDPITPYYSTTSNIPYKSDNNCSTNTKQNKSDCRDIDDNSSDDCDKCNNN